MKTITADLRGVARAFIAKPSPIEIILNVSFWAAIFYGVI